MNYELIMLAQQETAADHIQPETYRQPIFLPLYLLLHFQSH